MLHKGYTLLFAVLLSSLVLSISVSVLNLARKEIILSSGARESSAAIYIADGAIDCAVAYDNAQAFTSGDDETIVCDSLSIPVTFTSPAPSYDRYTFYVTDKKGIDSPCARVTVDRYIAQSPNPARTFIEARGYNLGTNVVAGTCDMPHPRKVERAFRYSYNQ